MAENKKSFILYADLIHTVKKLPKNKIADLFMTILEYVNDENPVVNDLIVSVVFEPIKHQLKRDLTRWNEFKKKQSENGKLGGRPKVDNEGIKNPNNPSLYLESQKSPNATANVNVTVISIAGEHDENKIIEHLRSNTDRRFITNEQIQHEAQEFKNKYDGMKIGNLKTLCLTWAGNIRPWQKKGMVV